MYVYLHRADIIIAIDNASHAIVTRWRWFAFIPLPNNFLYCSPTENGEGKFIFICLNSLRSQLNEWMKDFYNLYLHRESSRVKPGICSPAVDGKLYASRWLSVKDTGNYSTARKVRTWRILTHGNFYTSHSVPFIVRWS